MRLEVKVQGDRVRLVPYMARHVPKYHAWMQDPFLLEVTASEPLSLEEEKQMQVTWREDPTKATFIVHVHAFDNTNDETEDEMAGDVNLFFNDSDDNTNCEIDVMIAEAKWRGAGLGAETVQLMMAYAVVHLNARRFYCKINETNGASLKLFQKLGYVQCNYVKAFQEFELEFHITDEKRTELVARLDRARLIEAVLDD